MQPEAPRQDVCILIPAYNAETTIAETLRSVQDQEGGLDRVEAVYLADDASLDKTVDVARDAWKSSVRLEILRNRENQGERRTVNAAARQFPAGVRWFFILHADDIAKPNWLAAMLRVQDAASSEIASVTASYDVLNSDGRVSPGENRGEDQLVLIEGQRESITGTLLRGCWWKVSSCSIRVDIFLQLGGFAPDMPQLGDLDFVIRLLQKGSAILYIPLCLSIYRQTDQSVSSASFRVHRDVREWLKVLSCYADYLTPQQWRTRHFFLAKTLVRRTARSLLRFHWSRAVGAVGLLRAVITSAFQQRLTPGQPHGTSSARPT
jgi:glycosyltransferase involved in cell wall biosynthesis